MQNDDHLNMLLFENKMKRNSAYPFFDDYEIDDMQITKEILMEAINDMIVESDDPEYYVKFPKELSELTRQRTNGIIDEYDILTMFPEFSGHKFPKVYVSFFDFSDREAVDKMISSFAKFNDQKIMSVLRFSFMQAKDKRGIHIHFDKFGINLSCMFFNEPTYNERTIYHEWTHFFQTYVGEDFMKLVELSEKNYAEKNAKLKKYSLDMNTMRFYFFSDREYIAHLDNVLYMLHQAQKLREYSDMNDVDFFNMFKNQICKDELNSDIASNILSIDKNFKIDLIFFIAAYICFDGNVFSKLCSDLAWRL